MGREQGRCRLYNRCSTVATTKPDSLGAGSGTTRTVECTGSARGRLILPEGYSKWNIFQQVQHSFYAGLPSSVYTILS